MKITKKEKQDEMKIHLDEEIKTSGLLDHIYKVTHSIQNDECRTN